MFNTFSMNRKLNSKINYKTIPWTLDILLLQPQFTALFIPNLNSQLSSPSIFVFFNHNSESHPSLSVTVLEAKSKLGYYCFCVSTPSQLVVVVLLRLCSALVMWIDCCCCVTIEDRLVLLLQCLSSISTGGGGGGGGVASLLFFG